MLGDNNWQYLMFGAAYDFISSNTKTEAINYIDTTKLINSIKSPINESWMSFDTCERTGGQVRGIHNVFDEEEVKLFEQLLIRRKDNV